MRSLYLREAMCQLHTVGKSDVQDSNMGDVHVTPELLCLTTTVCCLPLRPFISAFALQSSKRGFLCKRWPPNFQIQFTFAVKNRATVFSVVTLLCCSSVKISPLVWALKYVTQLLLTNCCLSSQGIPMKNFKKF